MSCMEHFCVNCGHAEFNNNARSPSMCPKCGGQMNHTWDEQIDYERDQQEEEE